LCYHGYPKFVSVVVLRYYMTSSASRQRERILRCDWLHEPARWHHFVRSPGLLAVSQEKKFRGSHVINPLLTMLVQSRWLDIHLVLFCDEVKDLDSLSVCKHAEKELCQYQAILTSLLSNHFINNSSS